MDPAPLDALLKSHPALWRGRDQYTDNHLSVPTGFPALDKALPGRGWHVGGVTELLLDQHGIGELSLLLPGLRHVTSGHLNPESNQRLWAAFVSPPHIPYAPAFINAGIQLDRLLIINAADDTETLWATEQVLRSGLFGSVVSWINRSSAQRQRRLQLAAETGKTWAVVYRPLHSHKEHSPVCARICIESINQQLTLKIIKSRAGKPQTVCIKPDEFDASQGVEWPISAS
ncbi:MAG: translesion DNA synthesis-associated protein ImuA [Granulosicoccus sp.]